MGAEVHCAYKAATAFAEEDRALTLQGLQLLRGRGVGCQRTRAHASSAQIHIRSTSLTLDPTAQKVGT